METKNHEFRHPTDKDSYDLVRDLWKRYFFNLKWTGFQSKIFLLGLDQIKLQIAKQKK